MNVSLNGRSQMRLACRSLCSFVGLWVLATAVAFAQNPTGTVCGRVTGASGLPTPGVTVTVQSPNLQGTRTAVTTANGDYVFTLLPPGSYAITFELSGFATVRRELDVQPTQVQPLN